MTSPSSAEMPHLSISVPPLSPCRILVALPTYNERANIETLIPAILQVVPHAHVVVIDDGSRDGTGELTESMRAGDERIALIQRGQKLGIGSAHLRGLLHAVEHGYDLFITMDADFSHHPRYLPDLIAGMEECDVMIGSRYVEGGKIHGWPLKRYVMSWAVNVYSRLLLRLPVRDCSGGFRCYRVSKIALLATHEQHNHGYAFLEEFLYNCQQLECRIGETPIEFVNRTVGQSKINLREIVAALFGIFYVAILGRKPLQRTPDR